MDVQIDIIVPVYNDQEGLDQLLDSIAKQKISLDQIQVIVVDNNSETPIQLPETPFKCQLVQCLVPGSYAARNQGLSYIKSRLVAFTDADCILQDDWIREGIKNFLLLSDHMKRSVILAGEIQIIPSCINPTLADLTDIYFGMTQKKFVLRGGYGITANLWVRSEDLLALNGFNSSLKSGGDRDFCLRANEQMGTKIVYEKSCIARHPARNKDEHIIKCKRLLGGQFDRAKGNPLREIIALMLHLRPFIKESIETLFIPVSIYKKIRLIYFLLFLRLSVIPEWFRLVFRMKTSSRL